MTIKQSLVVIVDDDESVRESLPDLLGELGFAVQAFPSAEAYIASDFVAATSCLILDVAMPGMSGPELQSKLSQLGHDIPIIFITAHEDGTIRRNVMDRGAVDCLFKPFSESQLVGALNTALRVA